MLVANYGSNLNKEQFARRCPSAVLVGTGTIKGYRLTFTGRSAGWGGAVATIKPAKGEAVLVAVYELRSPEDVRTLDRCEGFPTVYGCEEFSVKLKGKRKLVKAWTYVKRDQREGQPTNEYLGRVAQGYKDHGFDAGVLAKVVCALPAGLPKPRQASAKRGAKSRPKGFGESKPRFGTARAPYGRKANGDPVEPPKRRKGKKARHPKKGKRKPDKAAAARKKALESKTCKGKGCTPDLKGGAECPWCGDASYSHHCPECCPEALAMFGAGLSALRP